MNYQVKTPLNAKQFFKKFLFPCTQKKTAAVPPGHSWEYNNPKKKPVKRSTASPLCGLDCGQASLIIVDLDTYKKAFKDSAPAKAFAKEVLSKSNFKYKTQSGGTHVFFKQPKDKKIGCLNPFPGIELKGHGGYICLYAHPADFTDYETFQDFYNDLPEFDFKGFTKKATKELREFGPGKNNAAVAQRASKAGAKQSLDQAAKDIKELFTKNAGRTDFDKDTHLKDYLKKFRESFFISVPQAPPPGPASTQKTSHTKPQAPTQSPASTQKKLSVNLHKKQKIKDIDWAIEDWAEFGDLWLIGGKPGTGKTTLAIKIAVMNALKRQLWINGPSGDGRKSLYICFERKGEKAHNKELSCGGDGRQIDILKNIKTPQGDVPLELEDHLHLETVLTMIENNNYFSVIFDPVVDLVLKAQNDNALVRKQVSAIFDKTHKMKTVLMGIAHLRKQKTGIDELGAFRGASELVNMATSVCRVFEMKDGEGYILGKLKVNESKTGKKGGMQYKIETLNIPDIFLEKEAKEKGKGGIRSITYLDKSLNEIKKQCIKDLEFDHKESSKDIVLRVIARLNAENRELNTKLIKDLAKADGVSSHYLNRVLKWEDLNYKAVKSGKGKDFKNVLKSID